jgi:diacylglycerol kinase family enzyme
MTKELRIKKIQAGNAKVGLLFNPLSGRILKHKDKIKCALVKIPGVIFREAKNGPEFKETVNEFLHTGVDLLVIAAGDGTVQAILSHLFTECAHTDWPILAIIPGGTTNMTALDLVKYDDPEDSVRKLSQYMLTRTLPVLLKRHVLCIDQAGVDKVYGMFFAVGIIARAVIFSRSGIKQVRITGEIYSGLIMVGYFIGLLLRRRKGAWAPAKMRAVKLVGKTFTGTHQFLFASALDRLLFNMRPYWGQEQEPLHVTFVKQKRKKSISSIWPLISGRGTALKEHDGYHSYNSSMLELTIDDDYIVDGESYHAASQNGPLKISAVGPVTFLTW